MRTSLSLLMLLSAALLAACPGGEIEPVAIVLDEDGCCVCFMAVSLRKFAAETVTRDGHVDYYDDIGCLAARAQQGQLPENSRSFVTDYDTEGWLDAQAAQYVQAAGLPTPMSYGLAALAGRPAAARLGQQYGGRVLTWEQLLKEFAP